MNPTIYRFVFKSALAALAAFPFPNQAANASPTVGATPPVESTTRFEAQGRSILCNGQKFYCRGVCYQPTKPSQMGDYFSSSNRAVWARDVENLRKLGANTIRLYAISPDSDPNAFLDALWNQGKSPIHVWLAQDIAPNTKWQDQTGLEKLQANYEMLCRKTASHPAVLGYLLGNELNAYDGESLVFWAGVAKLAAAVKAAAPHKLVSMPISDRLDHVQTHDLEQANLDCWSVQVYRGKTFGKFFAEYEQVSKKPLLVTEYGMDAYDAKTNGEYTGNAQEIGLILENLTKELELSNRVTSGGCLYSYADAWWKAPSGLPTAHDSLGQPFSGSPDGQRNDEWFGIYRLNPLAGDSANISMEQGTAPTLEPRFIAKRLERLWVGQGKGGASSPENKILDPLVPDREWTNSSGQKLSAALISVDAATGYGKFQRANGTIFSFEIFKLTPEDQSLISKAKRH